MTYLLLTGQNVDNLDATLLNLNHGPHVKSLSDMFADQAHTSEHEPPFDRIYVIDPEINDGVPTLCRVHSTTGEFDGDDYADAHVTILQDISPSHTNVVHRFGYRIDGRS